MTDSWVSVVRGLAVAGLMVASPLLAETVRVPAALDDQGAPVVKMQATTIATLRDVRDHIAVIEVEGNFDKEIDGVFNAGPRQAIAQTFYETFPDAFDFLVVFSSFEFDTGDDVVAFHVGVRNTTVGTGQSLYDDGALFGSEARLQGYVDMAALSRWVTDPQRPGFDFTLGTLAHEVMHQWCCYVDFQASGDPAPRGDLLGRADAHWSYLLDTDASVMYGHDWRDNADGTFSIVGARRIYSPLDLYLAGFLDASEVPDFTLIASGDADPDDIPDVSGTITGTAEAVSVSDVIAAEGLRQPVAGEAQRDFRAGFVFVVRPGETMSAAQQLAIHRIRAAFGSRFSVLTGGRGVMEVFPPGATHGDTGEPTPVEGGPLSGQPADVDLALAWLRAQQRAEGFWEDRPGTRLRDTQVVADVLLGLDPAFDGGPAASAWLSTQEPATLDFYARQLIGLARLGADTTLLRALVAGRQNPDGGWGVADGYDSEPLDTALALSALAWGGVPTNVLSRAEAFLEAAQHDAGGWPHVVAGPPRGSVTAAVLESLALAGSTSPAQLDAATWLAAQQNGVDGGFGDSPSSAHGTAQVLVAALVSDALTIADRAAAEGYLGARQAEDGSWDGSVYATALAVRALRNGQRPNWLFDTPPVAAPAAPDDGERVLLTASVANVSGSAAPASRLDWHDGDPQAGGALIASLPVPALEANQRVTLAASWDTFGLAGPHTLFATIDPDGTATEAIESDNVASLIVEVAAPPTEADLEIRPVDVDVTPARPDQLPTHLTLLVNVRNLGQTSVEGARLVVTAEPAATPNEATVIDDRLIDVGARSNVLISLSHPLTQGGNVEIRAQVDPDGVVVEADEDNNAASRVVELTPTRDLEVTAADLALPGPAIVGADAVFEVTVRNRGTLDLPQAAELRARVDDGAAPIELPSRSVFLLAGEERTLTIPWRVDREGPLVFRVELDGLGTIETDTGNNAAELAFDATTLALPNLRLAVGQVGFTPDPAREGAPLLIDVTLENTGTVSATDVEVVAYDGNPADGGARIGAPVVVPTLAAGAHQAVSLIWDLVSSGQDRLIFVVVDPSAAIEEIDETDNQAFAPLAVASLPDLAVSPAALSLTPPFPRPGDVVTLTATISNLGEQTAANVAVEALGGGGALAPAVVLPTVPGGARAEAIFSWTVAADQAVVTVAVVVDPGATIVEGSETNNSAERTFGVQQGSASVDHRLISPNGDGVQDAARLFFRSGDAATVRVDVVTEGGRVVRAFVDPPRAADGTGDLVWDGRDDRGRLVADGPYALRVVDAGQDATLGEVEVVVDTNRASLLDAVGTPWAWRTNATCRTPRAQQLILAPDEEHLYFRIEDDLLTAPFTGIYRMALDGSGVEILVDKSLFEVVSGAGTVTHRFDAMDLAVSADGSRIAWTARERTILDYQIWVADATGGARSLILDGVGINGDYDLVGFGPNADSVVALNRANQLIHVPVDGTPPTVLLENEGFLMRESFALAPDQRTVLAFGSDVIDLETGQRTTLATRGSWMPNGNISGFDGTSVVVYDRRGQRVASVPIDGYFEAMPEALIPAYAAQLAQDGGAPGLAGVQVSWSTFGDEAAVVVGFADSLGRPTLPGCFNPDQWRYSRILSLDLAAGVVNHLAWTAPGFVEARCGDVAPLGSAGATATWVPAERSILVTDPAGEDGLFAHLRYLGLRLDAGREEALSFTVPPNAFAPSGRVLRSRFTFPSVPDGCLGTRRTHELVTRSLMNLVADVRVRRNVDGTSVRIEGTASDLHLASWSLDYANVDTPEVWRPLTAPQSARVVDGRFVSWVPPSAGSFLVRLTVRDHAGNETRRIDRVSSIAGPAVVDAQVTPSVISPNGDGIAEAATLSYRVLEPVNVEIQVKDENGGLVRVIPVGHPVGGVTHTEVWDGTDDAGMPVADGTYSIDVAGFALPVTVDTTPPAVSIDLLPPFRDATAVSDQTGRLFAFVELSPKVDRSVTSERADDEVETSLQREDGAAPNVWVDVDPAAPIDIVAFTNARYRVVARDAVGNEAVATSGLGDEKVMVAAFGSLEADPDGIGFRPLNIAWGGPRPLSDGSIAPEPDGPFYRVAFGNPPEGGGSETRRLVHEGPVLIVLNETVRVPLVSVVLEYRPLDAVIWRSVPVDTFVERSPLGTLVEHPVPTDHQFGLLWDTTLADFDGDAIVRVRAEDANGQVQISNVFRVVKAIRSEVLLRGPVLESDLTGDDPANVILADLVADGGFDLDVDTLLWATATTPAGIESIALFVRSDEDEAYALWQPVDLVAQEGEQIFVFEAAIPFQPCTRYEALLQARNRPFLDPFTGEIVQPEVTIEKDLGTTSCLMVASTLTVAVAEACGVAPPGELFLRVMPEDRTGLDQLALLTVSEVDASGAEDLLHSVVQPTSNEELTFTFRSVDFTPGLHELVIRLRNESGNTAEVRQALPIDVEPPTVEVVFPQDGQALCGDVAGRAVATDDQGVTGPVLDSGVSEIRVPFASAGDISFVLGIDEIAVVDYGGHLVCAAVPAATVDARVDDVDVVLPRVRFSPDGDGTFDTLAIELTPSGEALSMTAWIFEYCLPGDGACSASEIPVRTLATEAPLVGATTLTWDGRDDGGALAVDRAYQFVATFTDACGNQDARPFGTFVRDQPYILALDTTPPVVEIIAPRTGDPLPVMVPLVWRAFDATTQIAASALEFGLSHDPETWQTVPIDVVDTGDGRIGVWNTFGLEGDVTLRLWAVDLLGFRSETRQALTLGVGPGLVSLFEAVPIYIAPNGDGVRESTALRLGLTTASQVDLSIENPLGATVRVLATDEALGSGIVTRVWDGRDGAGSVVPDGDYEAVVVARFTNNPGVFQEERVPVIVDATPPSLVLSEPALFVRGPVVVQGTVADAHLDGYTVSVAPRGTAAFEVVAEGDENRINQLLADLGTTLDEGDYTVRLAAIDAGQISSERVADFTVDRTPPDAALTAPAIGAVVGAIGGPVEIVGTAQDLHLATWRLEQGVGDAPTGWTVIREDTVAAVDAPLFAWDVTGLADGRYTLRLTVEDRAGNASESRVAVAVDNTPPTVALTTPASGDFVSEPTVTTGTASDANLLDRRLEIAPAGSEAFSLLAVGLDAISEGVLFDWQGLPPDGAYRLRLTARDQPGHVSTVEVALTVDTQPPSAPTGLTAVLESNADGRLNWNRNGESDLAGYHVYRGGARVTTSMLPATAQPPTHLDPNLGEGIHTWTVTALDRAGQESEPSTPASLDLDRTPPQVAITAPTEGARVAGVLEVRGTAASADDFAEYRLWATPAGGAARLLRQSPVPIVLDVLAALDTFTVADGSTVTLRLEGEDVAGNVAATERAFVVDNQPPAAPITLTGAADGRDAVLDWSAVSAPDGAGYVLFRDGRVANAPGPVVGDLGAYAIDGLTYRDADRPDGTFTYEVHAIDQAGNLSDPSPSARVTIEGRAPRAVIEQPFDGARFESVISVRATTVDQDIASVQLQYRLEGAPAWLDLSAPDVNAPYEALLDPVAMGFAFEDRIELRAVATDTTAQTDPAPASITVIYRDLTPPSAPVGVATRVDGGEVTVRWEALDGVDDLDRYQVLRAPGLVGGAFALIADVGAAQTEIVDPGLADGDYRYVVVGIDTQGLVGPTSDEASARVYTPALVQPYTPTTAAAATLVGAGAPSSTVTVVVESPDGVTTLPLASTDSEGSFAVALPLALGDNEARVTLEDALGNRSKRATVRVAVATAPSPPQGLVAVVTGFDVDLGWDANPEPDILGYRPLRNGVSVLADLPVTTLGGAMASSALPSGPAEDAFDGDPATYWTPAGTGVGAWLSFSVGETRLIAAVEVTFQTQVVGQDIVHHVAADFTIEAWTGHAWVTVATVADNVATRVEVALDQPYRSDRLRLVLGASPDLPGFSEFVRVAEVAVAERPLVASPAYTDVAPDGTFGYRVTAVNVFGFESLPSDEVTLDVGDVTPPESPVLSAMVEASDVALSWTVIVDAARYDLYRDGVPFTEHLDLADTTAVDALRPNGTYVYTVRAVDAAGNASAPSNEVEVTVAVPVPSTPTDLIVTVPPIGATLDLAWAPGLGQPADAFVVRRSTTPGGPYTDVATLAGLAYRDQGLTDGQRYHYVIVGIDLAGNRGAASNEASGVPSDGVPAQAPTLYFPTVPGRVLAVTGPTADLVGRSGAGALVVLKRAGVTLGTTNASTTFATASTGGEINGDLRPSPTGRLVLADDVLSDVLIDFDGDTVTSIVPLAGSSVQSYWMPDGRTLLFTDLAAFGTTAIGLHRLDDGTSTPLVIGDVEAGVFPLGPAVPSPDGTRLAVSMVRDFAPGVFVFEIAANTWTLVDPNSFSIGPIRWSPDGTRLAYADPATASMRVVHLDAGIVTPVATEVAFEAPSWSPDGGTLALVTQSAGRAIVLYDLTTGGLTTVTDGTRAPRVPAFGPSGARLAFIDAGSSVVVLELATGEETLLPPAGTVTSLAWGVDGYVYTGGDQTVRRWGLPGRFTFDAVPLIGGDNVFTAERGGSVSAPIVLSVAEAPKPDLAIEVGDVTVLPSALNAGDELRVTVTVRNVGAVASVATEMAVVLVGQGLVIDLAGGERVPPLAPDASHRIERAFVLDGPPGPYTVLATADPFERLDEASESNNRNARDVVILAPGTTAAVRVFTDLASYGLDETVSIDAEIRAGGAVAGELVIAVIDGAGFHVAEVDRRPVVLASGESLIVPATWSTGSTFAGDYGIRATLSDATAAPSVAVRPITILPSLSLELAATASAATLPVGTTVGLTGTVVYANGNEPVVGARAVLWIVDADDHERARFEQPLGTLLPGAALSVARAWPSTGAPVGEYRVRFAVERASGVTLATADAAFTLVGATVDLAGTIEPPTVAPEPGDDLAVGWTVRQGSGAPVGSVNARIRVLSGDGTTVVRETVFAIDLTAATPSVASGNVVFDATGLALGPHLLALDVERIDDAGTPIWVNLDVADIDVVDRTPPALTVVAPADGGFVTQGAVAEVAASDALSPVAVVEVRFDGGAWSGVPALGGGRWGTGLEGLPEGLHTIAAAAVDGAGNRAETTDATFVVDRTPPVISIAGVADGDVTTQSVTVDVTVVDLHPATETIILNGAAYVPGTAIEAPGHYRLVVEAEDQAGNRARATRTFDIVDAVPRLVVEKTAALHTDADADGAASAGDVLRYTVIVRNDGYADATDVRVTDPLPRHATLVAGSAQGAGTVEAEQPLTIALGTLATGAEAVVTFDVTVDPASPVGTDEIVNQAWVSSTELPVVASDDPSVPGAVDPTVTPLGLRPDLIAFKTGDRLITPLGDQVLYAIAITNRGWAPATGVWLVDVLPDAGMLEPDSVTVEGGTVVNLDPLEIAIADVAPGDERALSFVVSVDRAANPDLSELVNQATVSSVEQADLLTDDPRLPGRADPTVTSLAGVARLALTKRDRVMASPVAVGDPVLYQLRVENLGTTTATDVVLEDLLPAGLALDPVSIQTSQGVVDAVDPLRVLLGDLTPTSVATVTFTTTVTTDAVGEVVVNQAQAAWLGGAVVSDDPDTAAIDDPTATELATSVQLSVVGDVVTEGAVGDLTDAVFLFSLSRPSPTPVQVDYATREDSATAGVDFVAVAGTLVIPPGMIEATVVVSVLGDALDEPDETFRLTVTNAIGATLADSEATTAILDDDETGLEIADARVEEGDEGSANAVLVVTLAAASGDEISVEYATVPDTAGARPATEGVDYSPIAGTLIFPAGTWQRTIEVPVFGDRVLERDETLLVVLSNPMGATLTDGEAVLTIEDDEACVGPNLIRNPGAEATPLDGEVPGWVEREGEDWQARLFEPDADQGDAYFWAGSGTFAELVQEVDVTAYASLIDGGEQVFRFSGALRVADEDPPHAANVVVEYRDGIGGLVLGVFESEAPAATDGWFDVFDERVAPVGTRVIAIRLLSTALGSSTNDGYFDRLSLRSLGVPVMTLADASPVWESDVPTRAIFRLSLSCFLEMPVTVDFTTQDGLAQGGADFVAASGTVSLDRGEVEALIEVEIIDDDLFEESEDFSVVLSGVQTSGSALPLLLDPEAVGWIEDQRPCKRSPGYWKNHRSAWPVLWLRLGGVLYDADVLQAFLEYGGPDASLKLARHVVANKLNLASGADPTVQPTVDEADLFLSQHPPGSRPTGADKAEALRIKDLLDVYHDTACASTDPIGSDSDSDSDSDGDSDSDSDGGNG